MSSQRITDVIDELIIMECVVRVTSNLFSEVHINIIINQYNVMDDLGTTDLHHQCVLRSIEG